MSPIPNDRFFSLAQAAVLLTAVSGLAGLAASFLPPAGRRAARALRLVLVLAAAFFVVFFSWLVCRRLMASYQALDSSYFLQAMYNSLYGRWLGLTCFGDPRLNQSFLALHFSPILVLVAQLYRLVPSPFIFFLFQVWLAASAVWPVRQLGRLKLNDELLADLLALTYILSLPLQSLVLSEFREVALAAPLILWAFYFLESGRRSGFAVCFGLVLLCKEEFLVLALPVALFLWLVRRDRTLGAAVLAASLILGGAYFFFLLPQAGRAGAVETDLAAKYFGRLSPGPLLDRLLSWRNLQYTVFVFGPWLGLAFFSRGYVWLFILPYLATLFSTYARSGEITRYYSANLWPFVLIASLAGLARFQPLSRRARNFFIGYVLADLLLTNVMFGRLPLNPSFAWAAGRVPERYGAVRRLVGRTPPEAAVAVANEVGPWFSLRRQYYVLSKYNLTPELLAELLPQLDLVVLYRPAPGDPYQQVLAGQAGWQSRTGPAGLVIWEDRGHE